MGDTYVTMTIRRGEEGKVVLIVTCDMCTMEEGFLFDIIEQYTMPDYEIKIKTEEVNNGKNE